MVNLKNMVNPSPKPAQPSSPPVVASYFPQRVTTTVEILPARHPSGPQSGAYHPSTPPSSPIRPTANAYPVLSSAGGATASSSSREQQSQVPLRPLPTVVGRVYPWPPESSGVSKTFYAVVSPRTTPVGIYTRSSMRRVLAPYGGWESLAYSATSPFPKGSMVGYQQLDTAVKFLCSSGQLTEPVVRIFLE